QEQDAKEKVGPATAASQRSASSDGVVSRWARARSRAHGQEETPASAPSVQEKESAEEPASKKETPVPAEDSGDLPALNMEELRTRLPDAEAPGSNELKEETADSDAAAAESSDEPKENQEPAADNEPAAETEAAPASEAEPAPQPEAAPDAQAEPEAQ